MRNVLPAYLLLAILGNLSSASAAAVIQTTDVRLNGKPIYAGTGQVTDEQTCNAVKQQNLIDAPTFGYQVDDGTFHDPASGISVRQGCSPAWPLYEAPRNPISAAPTTVEARAAIPCPPAARRLVIFVFGQSNAANAGEARYAASPHVYVHRAGQCYPAHDPLVGSDGVDGSPWGRLGDKLVAAGLYDNVVIVAAAVSGVQMAAWAEGGSLNSILMARVSDAVSNGMKPDVYLLVQGEGDVLLTNPSAEADLPQIRAFAHGPAMTRHDWRDQFISALGSTIRRLGLVEPIYVSRVTRCNQRDANVRGTDLEKVIWRNPSYYIAAERTRIEVREGQLLGVNGFGVRAGPDLDTLPAELSFDGCHRSRRGLDESAKLWLTILSGGL